MKKFAFVTIIALILAAFSFSPVAAAQGGMPGAHGVDGKSFGAVVSSLAQSDPGALAAHTSGGKAGGSGSSNGGGMPAAHGVDGKTFGSVVSWLAQTNPAALAAHVSGR